MSVEQGNEASLISKKAFQAVGLKWKGSFEAAFAGEIRDIQNEMQNRVKEISYALNPEVLLGLSYHATPDSSGFIHYAATEVEKVEIIPHGMVSISVPSMTYAKFNHRKGQSIKQSYENIYDWINRNGYRENNVDYLTHFEIYPITQDPYDKDPEFTIMIPINEDRNERI